MYLVGAWHPNKDRAIALVTRLVQDGEQLVTSAEVCQEILHRYSAMHRLQAAEDAFRVLATIADEILTFGMSEVREAMLVLRDVDGLSARDALHVAVMRKAGVTRILSFDRSFDDCLGIERVY